MGLRSLRLFCHAYITALALSAVAPLPAGSPSCQPPDFPDDCVEQLGAIGEPPVEFPDEGFRNIVAPVVDPLLLLQSSNASNGLLFVLNPLGNRVRVLDPAAALAVVADIRVCYRPSALTQSADGGEVLVACHASNAIGVIDSASLRMVAEIQHRDGDGRPLLQEPMGMAVVGDTLYVASSQNHRIAVVDLPSRSVAGYIDIPGEDPRSLSVTPDGAYLVVANLLAGNRSEPDMVLNGHIYFPGGVGTTCAPLLEGDGANVIDESHADFMDTAHPDYPLLAECYLFAHTFGGSSFVVTNESKPDHDLVVVRLSDRSVVFSSDSLAEDVGTLNYAVRHHAASGRVYLAATHARNALGVDFDNRPLVNRLAILDLDPLTGELSPVALRDLDELFLDEEGEGNAVAATPYAVAIAGERVVIAAAASDRLVVTDLEGTVTGSIQVGFTPKGVVVDGDTAYAFNSTGLTVSRVDLVAGEQTAVASIGANPMPQTVRIGAHLMNSAHFASNKTFACASCHPDGHLDGLVWMLNSADGLRSTQSMHEIAETGPYHWDGAKCNLVQILVDGITGLFQNPAGPSPCEMKTSIDFIESLVRPHSPYRALDDDMTVQAKLGLGVIQRGRYKSRVDEELPCNGREQDPNFESKFLAAVADPYYDTFTYNVGGGPVGGTSTTETCSISGCHVAPHWNGEGGEIEAMSIGGIWDRPISMHHGRSVRAKWNEALEINRAFHGAPPMDAAGHVTGKLAAHGFVDGHFRHPELNFDANDASNAFTLTDAMTQFMLEEEQLQAGSVGLTTVLDMHNADGAELNARLALLQSAANQRKISYLGVGLIGGALRSLVWSALAGKFMVDDGGSLTLQQLKDALIPGDSMLLYGALPSGQETIPNPKLRSVTRTTAPVRCSEAYADYHAALTIGETNATIRLGGSDVVAGSRVMIDGQVTGAPLVGPGPDFNWTLPQAPSEPAILALQVLSPRGMQSNSIPLPVVAPVVAAFEPDDLRATRAAADAVELSWTDQFGITGPGTRYDVFRGMLDDLSGDGLAGGGCLGGALNEARIEDGDALAAGEGYYYVVRAQNQLGVTSWGSPERDADAAASTLPCLDLFP